MFRFLWPTLRQAQKIVWLKVVRFCLDILVPILANGHDDANIAQTYADIELPSATFYALNGALPVLSNDPVNIGMGAPAYLEGPR